MEIVAPGEYLRAFYYKVTFNYNSQIVNLKKTIGAALFIYLLVLSACEGGVDRLYQQMSIIDAHAHIRTDDPAVMEFARSEGFKFVTINSGASSQEHIDMQMHFGKDVKSRYPDVIIYITTFSMVNFEEKGWAENVIIQLKSDFESGADGVKVWKDIGMTFRDSLGELILIDDPLFDPLFEYVASEGKTVVAHIGEPRNYLLAKHPDLKLVGAHFGSLEWNVDGLAKRLDRYPNFAVYMAARVCHLQVQNREKVRDFISKYQDRLLYATDLVISADDDMEQRISWLKNEWRPDCPRASLPVKKSFSSGRTVPVILLSEGPICPI